VKIGIIIQARMGSVRLPGKVLCEVGDRALLGHVIGRLGLLRHRANIIVATSDQPQDDAIAKFCKTLAVKCFRGSEQDVLARYYSCARQYEFEHIVRLTADNPFTDIVELDSLIDLHLHDANSYTHSYGQLPVGVGAEIFSFEALKRSWREADVPHHREHVNEYFLENPAIFKTGALNVPVAKSNPSLRLTIDTKEDWSKANDLLQHADGKWLMTEQLIELCLRSA
jgi:spore coat polysaccharide biosynthesis protein SpsF